MIELDTTNIRHFKLSSGEEVIAIVNGKSKDNMLVVEHPMLVHTAINQKGISFMFTSWQPMAKDDTCMINPMHIISHVECSNDIKAKYVRMCIGSNDDSGDTDNEDDHDERDEYLDSLLSNDGPDGSDTLH